VEFIGRIYEQDLFKKLIKKNEASILIVYGRRRIGKTSLIEHVLKEKKVLKLEGKQGQKKKVQIQHVLYTMARFFKEPLINQLAFQTWTEVFNFIADKTKKGEWYIYLEELQWLSSYDDELIADLKEVWDNSLRKNSKLRLILCGSAPSFMISQVLKSKALYNRSQYSIPLDEFSLSEVQLFFQNKKNNLEVMDALLSVGGIPEYLKYLKDESRKIYLFNNIF
jgi:AAA+ ATPase superfamily predicted ATPase